LKKILAYSVLFALVVLPSCSKIGIGFGSYDRPAKRSNTYYRKNFKLTNTTLKIGRRYIDKENKGLSAQNPDAFSYFTFFENGYVLHNSDIGKSILNYSEIHSQDVGSYTIKGDTIYWATRPGYLSKKMMAHYQAIITDSGLKVINSTKFKDVRFFSLQ
jgi:hypothetical protein